jgi:hypothetical protein
LAISGRGSAAEDTLTELEIGLGHMGAWAKTSLPRPLDTFPRSGGSIVDFPPSTISDCLDGLLPLERYKRNAHDLRMFVIRAKTDSRMASTSVSDGFDARERAQIRSERYEHVGIGSGLRKCVGIGTDEDDSEPEFEPRQWGSPTRPHWG